MERNAIFILNDGTMCAGAKESPPPPRNAELCVVEYDGVAEFARVARNELCPRVAMREQPQCVFLREANYDDSARLAGNLEAAARARNMFIKWMLDGAKPLQIAKLRFSVKRERLSLMVSVGQFVNFQHIFETLEKKFQTKIVANITSPREIAADIGGIGPCGCGFCCRNGVAKFQPSPDMSMAKNQSMQMHDFAASGICGKLKCCAAFEK
ncbi:MAG: hypothetical protein FWG05_04465 [Kiritimatiellaeota bacterium]|nr:hypothetical protein [Kiritimatiellota bacterium]